MTDQPGWLLALVAAVERYEEEHSKIGDGEECFAWPLKAVPTEVRAMARGYAQARRDAAAVPVESERTAVPLHWMLAPPAPPAPMVDTAPASRSCPAFRWPPSGEPGGRCVVVGEHGVHRDEHGHEWVAPR